MFSKANALEQASIGLIILATFLLPIFFVPSSVVSFEFAKSGLVVATSFAAVALLIINRLRDGKVIFSKNLLIIAITILPFVYLLASLFSPSFSVSFAGYGFESGTVVFITALSMLALATIYLCDSREKIFSLYVSLLASFLVVAVFHLIRFIGGPDTLSFGFFNDITNNTLGKWNDVALFFGFISVLLLVTLELLKFNKAARILLSISLVVSLFFLAVINFFWIWVVLGAFALVFTVYMISFGSISKVNMSEGVAPEAAPVSARRKTPIISLAVLLISLVFILGGKPINTLLVEFFRISHVDVRPTFSATFDIGKEALKENVLFGAGPNRFAVEWLLNKPPSVNNTLFWNIDFSYGVGFIPTALTTVGVVGLAAWLFLLGAFLYSGYRVLMTPISDRFSRYLTVSSFLGALYLWVFNTIYVPSASILTLTFLFSGIFMASAMHEGVFKLETTTFSGKPKLNFAYIFGLILAFILIVTIGYLYVQKFVSSVYFQKSAVALNQKNDPAAAEAFMMKAINVNDSDIYLRSLSEIYLVKINQLVNSDRRDAEAVRTEFQSLLRLAETAARRAVVADNTNYQNWLSLARVYETVVTLNVPGAYDNAKAAYEEAIKRNPRSPLILTLLGRLEVLRGNRTQAADYLRQALAQKPDYADASAILNQIEKRR